MSGERVLVVDDSLEMRDFLANTILSTEGYAVSRGRNGAEGLEVALSTSPDLIITDLAMPEMDGLQMLEELRRRGHSMPAILMTAEGSEDIAVRALRVGVMDYFVKPFDALELRDAIKRVLGATRIGALRAGVPDQRRLQVLNTLIAVGKSVTSLLDLEQILLRVVEAAVFLSGAEEGSLMLVDQDNGELYVRAAKNLQDGLQNIRLRVNDSLAGRVVHTGEPLIVGGEGFQKIKTAYLVRSLLYAPLKVGNRVIGVLGVHNRVSDSPLSQQAVGSVTALADYAAIAIVNAQLYQQADSERAKLNQILSQIQDAVLLIDTEYRVALCNDSARLFLNRSNDHSILGQPIVNLTDNRSLLELLEYATQAEAPSGEVRQGDRVFNAHISEVAGLGRAIVMQDITELKELDRIKSELVTMVSHDLRSPLTAILSYIELLGRVGELNEEQQEFTRQARHSVQAITSLINDLLDVGRIEAGLDRRREPLALQQIAQRAVEAERRQADMKAQRLIFYASPDLPLVLGNPTRLRQVFQNLLDNAIKYTPEGGEINVGIFEEADSVMAVVSDTGIGIPNEDQPFIFEKFYRVKEVIETHVGTGLGLSIVQGVIEAHNGRIWVQSTPNQGTTFTILLPAYHP